MIGKKLVSTTAVPLYEVKELIKTRADQSELGYEQSQTQEYVKKFAKVTKSKAPKLQEELNALNLGDEKLVLKIVDILPKDADQFKLLISKTQKFEDAKIEEILKIVKKYSGE